MIRSYTRIPLALCVFLATAMLMSGCQQKVSMQPEESKTIEADAPAETEPEADLPKGPLTSDEIIAAFKDAGLPIGTVQVYDANNDPNTLLGRPGQYTAKFNFADTRLEQPEDDVLGGSIESFENETDLQNRVDYVKAITESTPMFAEYQYTNGLMFLRLDKGLTPDQAAEYDKVFQTLGK
ncbi:MAG: hypothetical protein JXA57_18095 [Armatimonadetes bacterium]|nr:hypothetical protein [Armatimonadota bacterium]